MLQAPTIVLASVRLAPVCQGLSCAGQQTNTDPAAHSLPALNRTMGEIKPEMLRGQDKEKESLTN